MEENRIAFIHIHITLFFKGEVLMSVKRFSDIGFLRRLNFELLLTFLQQFEGYLTHQRSLELDENLLTFRYHHLAEILLTPDAEMPMKLVEGLYLVHELSQKTSMASLYRYLEQAGIFPDENLPIEDMLLSTLIEKPEILDYLNAEQHLVRPKKFETFFGQCDRSPTATDEALSRIETELNEWYSMQRKGRGVKMFRFFRPDGIWFLIQHGKPLKCDFTHEDNGDSRRILYRPGTFDVLIYSPFRCDLQMHTATKTEKLQYLRLLGRHLFDDEQFFQSGDVVKKDTLEPLKGLSRNILSCYDIDGIESVKWVEAHVDPDGSGKLLDILKSESDLFDYHDFLAKRVTEKSFITRAKFRIRFSGDTRERCMTICAPNIAIYDREGDGQIVEMWLKLRGFSLIRIFLFYDHATLQFL